MEVGIRLVLGSGFLIKLGAEDLSTSLIKANSTDLLAEEESKMNPVCKIHDDPKSREKLDHIIKNLPKKQAGGARHRCSYCAYLKGWNDAIREIEKRSKEMIRKD